MRGSVYSAIMKTRTQYLNGEISHFDYYAQFVDGRVKNIVRDKLAQTGHLKNLKQKLSDDKNLNNIPLWFWDGFSQSINTAEVAGKMKQAGDFLTLAGIVCLAKTAAKILAEET